MKGYGLTVFTDFKIERFQVEVISVLKNFLPKQDIFLVKVDHPIVRKTGVVAGMSGSPIYLQGKLSGALAYGWLFSKEPIAGITPIATMLDLLKREVRGPQQAAYALNASSTVRQLALSARERWQRWWRSPFRRGGPSSPRPMMTPVTVPLNVAGYSAESLPFLKKAFSSFGFEPVQGGGTGEAEGPSQFEAGGAVGIQLVRGDMSVTGTGTVTWTGKDRVLGFGHKMFNAGEIHLPAVSARVNHTLASLQKSFKISSPARVLGSLIQDRQAGILVDTSRSIGVIPVTVTVLLQNQKRSYKTQVARHRLLTPSLVTSVLANALSEAVPDVTHSTAKITTRFSVRNYSQVTLTDHVYSPSGPRISTVLFARGLDAIEAVMDNPFEPAVVERIDIEVDVKFVRDIVEIVAVGINSNTVQPGSRINVNVTFRPYSGADFNKSYPIEIPPSLGSSLLAIEVASGSRVRPEKAPPQNLQQFIDDLQEDYPARSLVITLKTPTEGIKLQGHVIQDLPSSVIDSFTFATQVRTDAQLLTLIRQVFATERVIVGSSELRLHVKNEVEP
jgi:hypothetical protein